MDPVFAGGGLPMGSNLSKGFRVAGIVSGVGVLCQFIGLVTPWWMVVSISVWDFNVGLWYASVCSLGLCKSLSYATFLDSHWSKFSSEGYFTEAQVEVVIALITVTLGWFILLASICRHQIQRTFVVATVIAILLSVSGIMSIVAVARFSHKTMQRFMSSGNFDEVTFGVAYSLPLTGTGGVSALVGAGLVIFYANKLRNDPISYERFGQGVQLQPSVLATASMPTRQEQPGMSTDPNRVGGYGHDQ